MSTRKKFWTRSLACGLCVLTVVIAGTSAFGARGHIEVISSNVEPCWIYTGSDLAEPPMPPPHYTWNMPSPADPDPLANDILNNGIITEGIDPGEEPPYSPPLTNWYIAPSFVSGVPNAELDWAGSAVAEHHSGGGIARASFAAGGIITISGQVWKDNPEPWYPGWEPFVMVYDGFLLEATVLEFTVREDGDTDTLVFEPGAMVSPTDGFLTDNEDGLVMSGDYFMQGTISAAQANGGHVDDFEGHIVTTVGFQWTLVQVVPEPTTALLFVGALAFAARRRRRAV